MDQEEMKKMNELVEVLYNHFIEKKTKSKENKTKDERTRTLF